MGRNTNVIDSIDDGSIQLKESNDSDEIKMSANMSIGINLGSTD